MNENNTHSLANKTIKSLFVFFIEFICEILLLISIVLCIFCVGYFDSLIVKLTTSVFIFIIWYVIVKIIEVFFLKRKKE